jgi:hypothetical protein
MGILGAGSPLSLEWADSKRNEPTLIGSFAAIDQKLRVRGAPGMIRTCDLLVRSQTLYPTELRARGLPT